MKIFLYSVVLISLLIPFASSAEGYYLNRSVKDGSTEEFLRFDGPGQWDNYLSMNLPFEPVADLFRQLLIKERVQLTNRGEAHITVVTPIEFWNVLRPQGITIGEINEIAEKQNIQSASFEVICLGQGSAVLNNKTERTFYVVVESEDLIQIRSQIQSLFISKGGSEKLFNPATFYPHITLGFTSRDLHESDGIIKDSKSCVSQITMSEL